MKTFSAKTHEVKRDWYVVDASDMILGRLSTEIARRLRGKHKAEYTPHADTGDCIIVINAEKVVVTGRKFKEKMYYHHTGHPGGIKSISFDKLQAKNPARIIERAVKGMLPKTHWVVTCTASLKSMPVQNIPMRPSNLKNLILRNKYYG